MCCIAKRLRSMASHHLESAINATTIETGIAEWRAHEISASYEFHTFCSSAQKQIAKGQRKKRNPTCKKWQITNSITYNYLRMNGATILNDFKYSIENFVLFDYAIRIQTPHHSSLCPNAFALCRYDIVGIIIIT